jgi:hypothetical protein
MEAGSESLRAGGADRQATALGASLVAASFLLGLPFVYWATFVDEGDSFAVAALILRGRALYRDVFSHHFPLVYEWLAWAGRIAGPSVGAYRVSVLAFQTLGFTVALVFSRHRVAVGIAAVLWRLLAPFYSGNMAVYPAFSAALLFPLTVLGLDWAEKRGRGKWEGALLGGIAGLAVWNDPLTLAVSALLFLAVLVRSPRAGLYAVLAFACVAGSGALWLLGTGIWDDFWRNAVRFNADVYARYRYVATSPWEKILSVAASGLDVTRPRWWNAQWAPLQFPDRAWFAGAFFRVAVLAAACALLLERRFFAAVWLYAVAVLELALLGEERFRAAPFLVFALFLAARHATGGFLAPRGITRAAWRALSVVLLVWLAVASAVQAFSLRERLDYETNFGRYHTLAASLRPLACLPGTRLGWYPSDPYVYFFTGIDPLGGYPFLFPWVAEVAMDDVVEDATRGRAILWLDLRGSIWGYENRDFLADLYRFARERYRELRPGFFVSADLAEACSGRPGGAPRRE